MTKRLAYSAAQATLAYIRDNTDRLFISTTAPHTYSAASTQPQKIVSANVTANDWALVQSSAGPQLTFAARALTIEGSGSASHAVWARSSSSTILAMTEVSGTALLNSGATVNLSPWITYVSTSALPSTVVSHPGPPTAATSSVFSLTANGISIPVWTWNGHSYAWFSFASSVAMVATYNAAVTARAFYPARAAVTTSVAGAQVSFSLTENRHYCLKVNGAAHNLFIFADPPETTIPAFSGAGIYNVVTQYSAPSNFTGSAQTAINSAITAANAAGGGTVYVPAGHYRLTGSIIHKSNVALYLASGACVHWVANSTPTAATIVNCNTLTDAKVFGRGIFTAEGPSQTNYLTQLHTNACTRFKLIDVLFMDNYTTQVRLGGADTNALIQNIKLLSTVNFSDGIDFASGPGTMSGAVVEKCFVQSTDDSIAWLGGDNIYQWQNAGAGSNLTVRNNFLVRGTVAVNSGSFMGLYSYNVGTSPLNGFLFDNNDCLYLHNEAADPTNHHCLEIISNNYDNITVQNCRFEGNYTEFLICATGGSYATGYLHTLLLKDNVADLYGGSNSFFQGADNTNNITGVTWNNVTIGGVHVISLATGHISINNAFVAQPFTYI